MRQTRLSKTEKSERDDASEKTVEISTLECDKIEAKEDNLQKSKELNITENDKKSELLSLKVEENIEVAVISDMLKTSRLKVQDIPNDYRQPYRPEKNRSKVKKYCKKINLKKITLIFEQAPGGKAKLRV